MARSRLACFGIASPRKNNDGPHDMESIRATIVRGFDEECAKTPQKTNGRMAQMAFDKGRASRFAAGEREWTMDEINDEIAAAHTK